MSGPRGCSALTKNGLACNAQALSTEPFCFVHSPEHVEAAAEARLLGGQRRRREGTLSTAFDLDPVDTVGGLRRYLEIAGHDALSLDNSVQRVRLLISVVQAGIRLLEVTELEPRIRDLEAALRASVHEGDAT